MQATQSTFPHSGTTRQNDIDTTIALSHLVQTCDVIAIESVSIGEMLQLSVTALIKYTGYEEGYVFLKNSDRDTAVTRSPFHFTITEGAHIPQKDTAQIGGYDESIVHTLAQTKKPLVSPAQNSETGGITVFIPIIGADTVLGFYALQTSTNSEIPNELLLEAFSTIGYTIGRTLHINITLVELQKYKLAFESTSDHVVITDENGIIQEVNPGAEKMTGYPRDEMLGKHISLLQKKPSTSFYQSMWNTVKSAQKPLAARIENARRDGSPYVSDVHLSPVLGKDRAVQFIVDIERDVTREAAVDRMKTEIIGVASHQLRTPLTAIRWLSEGFLHSQTPTVEEALSAMSSIRDNATQLLELIQDLLNTEQIDRGEVPFVPHSVSLGQWFAEFAAQIEPVAKEHHVALSLPSLSEARVFVADPKILLQILHNLTTNAIRYAAHENGVVMVTVTEVAEGLCFTVEDNGIGIPPEEYEKIGKKFFRASNAVSKSIPGTGLGLYIVKQLAETFGGTLRFESEQNKGTRFFVTFPLTGMVRK